MTHWDILQLERATASSRSVRRAYARLLRVHRPDRDPEGFRKLHDAYERALRELGNEEAQSGSSYASAPVPDPVESEPIRAKLQPEEEPEQAISAPTMPEEMEEALRLLEEALFHGEAQVAPRMRAVEQALFPWPAMVAEWGRRVSAILERHQDRPDLNVSTEALLFELSQECRDVALLSVGCLDHQGEPRLLQRFGREILTNGERLANFSAAIVAARLACCLAAWGRDDGEELIDFAYPLLGEYRDRVLSKYEESRQFAAALDSVPQSDRPFWKCVLENPGKAWDWDEEGNRQALLRLQSSVACESAEYRLLHRFFSPGISARMPVPGSGQTRLGGQGSAPPAKKRWWTFWPTFSSPLPLRYSPVYALILIVIANVVRTLMPNEPTYVPPPPRPKQLPPSILSEEETRKLSSGSLNESELKQVEEKLRKAGVKILPEPKAPHP